VTQRAAEPALWSKLSAPDLRWALDRLPAAVLVFDEDLRVRYFNLAARRLVHPATVRVGGMLPDLGSEPPLAEIAGQMRDGGALVARKVELEDGRTLQLDGITQGRHHHDRLAVLRIEDVTTWAQQLRAGEDFVVNAAHEFLSPLTALASAAHVLQENPRREVRERFVHHIAEATTRLLGISRALLVLARAEAGVEPPRLEVMALAPLLHEVAATSRQAVVVDCADDLAVLADVDLLRQAIVNTVDNATRHSAVDVEVVARATDRRTVEIDVVDSGTGILPEHLDRVTSRFFSGAGRDSGGFGIGLSIAARAVEVGGGSFRVDSSRNGTRARITLPTASVPHT
jgi:two-component system phosphate regulon sensor histidine kinase PhoR